MLKNSCKCHKISSHFLFKKDILFYQKNMATIKIYLRKGLILFTDTTVNKCTYLMKAFKLIMNF